jgi:hypothetical protein
MTNVKKDKYDKFYGIKTFVFNFLNIKYFILLIVKFLFLGSLININYRSINFFILLSHRFRLTKGERLIRLVRRVMRTGQVCFPGNRTRYSTDTSLKGAPCH